MAEADTQTAMLLTEAEWSDLAAICEHYIRKAHYQRHQKGRNRKTDLCNRIIEAAR